MMTRFTVGVVVAGVIACSAGVSRGESSRAAILAAAGAPKAVELPRPAGAVVLPDEAVGGNEPIVVRLSQEPGGALSVRRASARDGRLYLGIRAEGKKLSGTAEVVAGGKTLQAGVDGELWLSVKPRIGRVAIRVSGPGTKEAVELVAPTTLVEARGRQIYVNGEPFLMKGAMSRNLTEKDAAYVHSLGINTLRGSETLADCEKYGFMSITSMGFGKAGAKEAMKGTDQEFRETLAKSLEWLKENSREAIASPNTLIVQLGNEKTGATNKPPDAQPLSQSRKNVSRLLVEAYNYIKPLSPMLLTGYSNQDLGFLTPDCLDVYMHNSFLDKDRYGYPWEDWMRWQGCLPPDGREGQGRPFVNSEFGSNRYLCQAYHGGPNNPVLEKIHAWNFPNRWAEFMEHGTAGGSIYCLYDLETPKDQGNSCFGILTFEGTPKLACWEIGHLWRDFDGEVRGEELVLTYKRDYWARGCRLTVTGPGGKRVTRELGDFGPRTKRGIALGDLSMEGAGELRWRVDFSTHGGLAAEAEGAWPAKVEEGDFLERLKGRDTYPFLSELFDAQVMTADGKPAPRTLAEMARAGDGLVPVALRKRNGVTYVVLISREDPNKGGPVQEGVTVDVAFKGKVEKVDDMTGRVLPGKVDAVETGGGLRLRNVEAARIPGAIGARADAAFKVPVYRITP